MIKKYAFLYLVFSIASSFAQLVNVESRRMQTDSILFALKNDFSLSYNNNNGQTIYNISNQLATQKKSKDFKKIYFLLGNYNIIKSGSKNFVNSWLLHFRFNYKLSEKLQLESFVQSQQNKLLDISNRNLVGIGMRYHMISKNAIQLFVANAYMYEIEKSDLFQETFYNHRNSSYLTLSALLPRNNVTITNTIYYQPLYKDITNYRILEQLKVSVPISKKFHISGALNYYFTSATPTQKHQYTSNIRIGFGIEI